MNWNNATTIKSTKRNHENTIEIFNKSENKREKIKLTDYINSYITDQQPNAKVSELTKLQKIIASEVEKEINFANIAETNALSETEQKEKERLSKIYKWLKESQSELEIKKEN